MPDPRRLGAALVFVAIVAVPIYAIVTWLVPEHLLAVGGIYAVLAAGILLMAAGDPDE